MLALAFHGVALTEEAGPGEALLSFGSSHYCEPEYQAAQHREHVELGQSRGMTRPVAPEVKYRSQAATHYRLALRAQVPQCWAVQRTS